MAISTSNLFKVGVGPSSSHTVSSVHAAARFAEALAAEGVLDRCSRVAAHFYGSPGVTGAGHGSPGAVLRSMFSRCP